MSNSPEDVPTGDESRFSRGRLLKRAGVAAATIGVGATLASCGDNEPAKQVPTDVNASAYPPMPPMPGMTAPTTRHLTSFFTKEEAATVDAFVARLIPGEPGSPGAREAAVPTYIDTKLSQFATFATPTYFHAPFAKPIPGQAGPQPDAGETIEVNAAELPRYGFQSDATPQDAYRDGLAALDTFTRKEHGVRFVELDSRKTGRRARGARSRRGRRVPRCQGLLQDGARGHLRGDVRRPGVRRESRLRRLEARRLPRRATRLHGPRASQRARSTSASRASATCRR